MGQGEIMAKILVVSYITELLQSRERVLQSAGYEVTAAQSLAAATNAIQQKVYDAAVLGFGVPEDQRIQFARQLKRENSGVKILMIYFETLPNTDLADALMPASANDEEILRGIHHLLKECKRERTG